MICGHKFGHHVFGGLLIAAWGFCGACNFGSAFDSYCAGNRRCAADAAVVPEAAPDLGPDTGFDAVVDAEPDVGPDTGGFGGLGQIRPPRSCSSRADCGANEICHPFGQVCMITCKTALDCPEYLDTCTEIRDSGWESRAVKVCACSTSRVCDSFARGFLCNATDNLCERICFNDPECSMFKPSRTCDQTQHLCQGPPQIFCSSNAKCLSPAQPRCDLANSRCVGCLDSNDCAGRTDGLSQCSPTGSCESPAASP
jgi:hypothetical protein